MDRAGPAGGAKQASAAGVVYDNIVEAPPPGKHENEIDSAAVDRTTVVLETFHRYVAPRVLVSDTVGNAVAFEYCNGRE